MPKGADRIGCRSRSPACLSCDGSTRLHRVAPSNEARIAHSALPTRKEGLDVAGETTRKPPQDQPASEPSRSPRKAPSGTPREGIPRSPTGARPISGSLSSCPAGCRASRSPVSLARSDSRQPAPERGADIGRCCIHLAGPPSVHRVRVQPLWRVRRHRERLPAPEIRGVRQPDGQRLSRNKGDSRAIGRAAR